MNILKNWLVSALVIVLVAYLLPGVRVSGFLVALEVSFILGAINLLIKPLLVLLTLPITVLTLGLFVFVINAFLIMLAAAIVPGFSVDGFLSAFIFSLVLSFVNGLVGKSEKKSSSRSSVLYEKSRFKN
jgi:putative membrane protein